MYLPNSIGNYPKRTRHMNNSQIINKNDRILDFLFDWNSYEMDEREMLNFIWKANFLGFTTKGNGGAYDTKARRPHKRQH